MAISVPQPKRPGTLSRNRPPGRFWAIQFWIAGRVLEAVVVQPGVHDHEAGEPLGHGADLREAGGAAPVLDEERDVAEVEA